VARDYSPTQRAALRAGRIELATFLDLFVDTESLHCSSLYFPISYDVGDGVTRDYEPLADRWTPGEETLSMGTDLTPEPINITFDASRASDDTDFVGRFSDAVWHRRRARLTFVQFVVGTSHVTPIAPLMSFEGNMDFRNNPESENSAPTLVLTIESGTFQYVGRNVQTRTDENQQRFFPGDTFFQDTPGLLGRELPWHRTWVQTGASSGAGGSSGGGVQSGWNRNPANR